jgi:hypothetical protein
LTQVFSLVLDLTASGVSQQAHKKRPGDMLMGMGGGSSHLAVFSKIDNQAGSYYVHQFAWRVIFQASRCTVFSTSGQVYKAIVQFSTAFGGKR